MERKRAPKADARAARPVILAALAEGATVSEACRMARCAPSAFYAWQRDDKEFKEGVARAREDFAGSVDEDIRGQTSVRLLELLQKGEQVVRTKKVTVKNGRGQVERIEEERRVEKRTTPKWVFDKLMPDSLTEKLAAAGGQVHIHKHEGAP